MNSPSTPPVTAVLPTAIILMTAGCGGLFYVLTQTSPSGGTRWLFFFVAVLAVTGSVLPGIAYLNRRFVSIPPATTTVMVRQALWVGVYIATIAWLQIGRVLSPGVGLLLALGFLFLEWVIRLWERSQWKP